MARTRWAMSMVAVLLTPWRVASCWSAVTAWLVVAGQLVAGVGKTFLGPVDPVLERLQLRAQCVRPGPRGVEVGRRSDVDGVDGGSGVGRPRRT